ncbi:MAG: hypothetical protein AAF351_12625 [Pseudomonadota bacterium]
METLFEIAKYLVIGFFGLIGLLIVIAVIFGKRVYKQWEYEADFKDASGREFGEFEVELSRIDKEEVDDTLKAKLKMRHEALVLNASVDVFIDQTKVLETTVEKAGRVFTRDTPLLPSFDGVSAGQTCRVLVDGVEIASAEFHKD